MFSLKRLGVLVLFLSISAGSFQVHAQTTEISTLLEKLAMLRQQLLLLQSGGGSSAGSCLTLPRTLFFGAEGNDVASLQTFLRSAGDYTYPEITAHFGRITEASLQAWQTKNGIVSSGSAETTGFGVAGMRTRARIAQVSCAISGTTSTNPSNPNTTPTPPSITQPTSSGGSCNVGGTLVQNNASRQFYSQPLVALGQSCGQFAQMRQCINGILTGSSAFQYISCAAQAAQAISCTVGNTPLAEGETKTFYAPPRGTICDSQNRTCSGGNLSGSSAFQYISCVAANALTTCTLDGVTIKSGDQKSFYASANVPYGSVCIGENRICTNGTLSGERNFNHASCIIPASPESCKLDGRTVAHGKSELFYSTATVLFGQDCTNFSGIRTCNNGVLDGDNSYKFEYASCYATMARSCPFITAHASTTVPHGNDKKLYTVDTVAYNQSCDDSGRARSFHCNDGEMDVPAEFVFDKCETTLEKTCTLDGAILAGGTKRTFYNRTTAPAGHTCAEYDLSRTCTNGALSGSATYKKAVCAPTGKAYCKVGSTYVADTKTITTYSQAVAPFGATCDQYDQVRTCKNGTLSGSFTNVSCKVQEGSACAVNGGSIAHTASATLFSDDSPSAGHTCAMNSQVRTCFNGNLSGNDAFVFKSCSDTIALSQNSNFANALSALEAALQAIVAGLAK